MNIPDNSKFEKMVKNRPALSLLPPVNKRLVAQFMSRSFYMTAAFVSIVSILGYKFVLNSNSIPFLRTRKNFRFESDPYSGKVRCSYNDVVNREYDY